MAAKYLLGLLVVFTTLLPIVPASGQASTPQVGSAVGWLDGPYPTPVEPPLDLPEAESLPFWILLCAFGGVLMLASVSWPMIIGRLRSDKSEGHK